MYDPGSNAKVNALPAPAGDSRPPKKVGRAVEPHRLLTALRRGRWWILVGLLAGGVLGFVIPKFAMPRAYETRTSVVFEGTPSIEGIPAPPERELRTLVDSVKLPTNLRTMKQRLRLEGPLDRIAADIDVTYDGDSNVITVLAEGPSPREAVRRADTLVEVFMEHQRAVDGERLGDQLASIDADLTTAEQDLERARRAYDTFRDEHGISDLSTETQQAIEQAAELSAAADLAQAEAQAQGARIRELQQAVRRSSSTSVVSEQRTSTDQVELSRLQTELAQARAQYSDEHPRVQSLEAQVAVLRQRVASGAGAVASRTLGANPTHMALQQNLEGSSADREAARQRQTEYDSLAAAARRRAEQLSAIEGQASGLLARVRVGEAHLNDLRAVRARVEDAQRSPSAGFRVVAPAVAPEFPIPSKARVATAVGLPIIAVLFAIGLLFGRELRGMRVRAASELGFWGGGPVVGSTKWPREPRGLAELIHELDDYAPDASGRTLVVGATDAEMGLASEIASRLSEDWKPGTLVDLDSYSEHMRRQLEAAGQLGTGTPGMAPDSSTALAHRTATSLATVDLDSGDGLVAEAWEGPSSGPSLRRAARLADRVLIVVTSGTMSAAEIAQIRTRLGRETGIGYVLVGVGEDLAQLPDRAGVVEEFWNAHRV